MSYCWNCRIEMKCLYCRVSHTYYDSNGKKHKKRTYNNVGFICPKCFKVDLREDLEYHDIKGSYFKKKTLRNSRKPKPM